MSRLLPLIAGAVGAALLGGCSTDVTGADRLPSGVIETVAVASDDQIFVDVHLRGVRVLGTDELVLLVHRDMEVVMQGNRETPGSGTASDLVAGQKIGFEVSDLLLYGTTPTRVATRVWVVGR